MRVITSRIRTTTASVTLSLCLLQLVARIEAWLPPLPSSSSASSSSTTLSLRFPTRLYWGDWWGGTGNKDASKTPRTNTRQQLRDQLLVAVLQDQPSPPPTLQAQTTTHQVPDLVQQLLSSERQHTYDPNECLFGPLYCTVAAFTPGLAATATTTATKINPPPPPLWERISLKKDNIKGQQYYYYCSSSSTGTPQSTLEGCVINYAEIWGPALHLRATGTFVPAANGTTQTTSKTTKTKMKRTCPDDFTVTVQGASMHIMANAMVWQLPIRGTSTLRVLYADPQMRIFVSPQASDSMAGQWENAGLMVVQVRSDLVTKNRTAVDLTFNQSPNVTQ